MTRLQSRILVGCGVAIVIAVIVLALAYIGHHRPPAEPRVVSVPCTLDSTYAQLDAASGNMAEIPPDVPPEIRLRLRAAAAHIQAARDAQRLCSDSDGPP